jgi:tripeptide aminopeptidase
MDKVTERFLRYVGINTQSDPEEESCPSTIGQQEFGKALVTELKEIGLEDVSMGANGYVMATLPSNMDRKVKTIGFIAHMDTSPDASGENIKPALVEYKGGDILLHQAKNIALSPVDFPDLNDYVGQTLIVTDGTTLLGADDKAGIAEIITAVEYLCAHPEIPHGTIKIAFTPDEEIGRGADFFDVKKFNADFAYTVDGGPLGELEYENFNAASAKLSFQGRNVHPGTAKNTMINSMLIAMEFNNLLPVGERPEYTEGYEGFIHLTDIRGDVEQTRLQYIVRDHSQVLFTRKKQVIQEAVNFINKKYGPGTVDLQLTDSYYNMKEKIEHVFDIVLLAKQAMEEVGVEPKISPIRGGTDGARLSYMGLPCPNIFTGGHNYHGRFEFIPTDSMKKAVDVILKIVELNSK